jgi:dihydrofolate reductase
VVAVGRDGAIGRAGALAWDAPEDLAHFRRTTLDHTIIMGATTWVSIGRPLPRRSIIVVTRGSPALPDGVRSAPSPEHALAAALDEDDAPLVAGGAQLYAALLPAVVRIHRTDLAVDVPDADTFFPPLDAGSWVEVATWPGTDPRLTFRTFDRRP